MTTTALLSLDEYLKTAYERDVEFVDGGLQERPVVFSAHGLLQSKIASWFERHEDEWGVRAGVEVRTRVSPTRVRLPDVVVDYARFWPPVLVTPPLIAVEIVSPGDSYGHIQEVVQDYRAMGIRNIWVVDPGTRTAFACSSVPWVSTARLSVEGTPIFLDAADLFAWLHRYSSE